MKVLKVKGLYTVFGCLHATVPCLWLLDWLVGCFGFNGPLRQYMYFTTFYQSKVVLNRHRHTDNLIRSTEALPATHTVVENCFLIPMRRKIRIFVADIYL